MKGTKRPAPNAVYYGDSSTPSQASTPSQYGNAGGLGASPAGYMAGGSNIGPGAMPAAGAGRRPPDNKGALYEPFRLKRRSISFPLQGARDNQSTYRAVDPISLVVSRGKFLSRRDQRSCGSLVMGNRSRRYCLPVCRPVSVLI